MALPKLPAELLLIIAENLPSKADVIALMSTHPRTLSTLEQSLYDRVQELERNSVLRWACERGNTNLASAMLDRGANILAKMNIVFQPLTIATLHGQLDMVKFLLNYDPSIINAPTAKARESCTAIMCATILENTDIVKFLLAQPDLDPQKPNSGFLDDAMIELIPALEAKMTGIRDIRVNQALSDGNKEIAHMLLADPRVEFNDMSLGAAVAGGCEDLIKLCLLQYPQPFNPREDPLLLIATRYNHTAAVQLLLEVADQHSDPKSGHDLESCVTSALAERTPLKSGKSLLAKDSININICDEYGRSPLTYAAINGNVEMMKLLVDTGKFGVECRDKYGLTPLSHAARMGEQPVEFLLGLGGIDPNSICYDGMSPLHYAAVAVNLGAMKALVRTGKIDINMLDKQGRLALWFAAYSGSPKQKEVMEFLLSLKDINPDLQDRDDRSPLHISAAKGNAWAVKALLATGRVNPDAPDYSGKTPLYYAIINSERGAFRPRSQRRLDKHIIISMLQERIEAMSDESSTHLTYMEDSLVPDELSAAWQLLNLGNTDPNVCAENGKTLLFLCVEEVWLDAVRLLLSNKKVNPEKQNEDGRTPFAWTLENWNVPGDPDDEVDSDSDYDPYLYGDIPLDGEWEMESHSEADYDDEFDTDSNADFDAESDAEFDVGSDSASGSVSTSHSISAAHLDSDIDMNLNGGSPQD